MGVLGRRWVKTEIFDRALMMLARSKKLGQSCVADAKAQYLEILVQRWADLSKKEIWTKLHNGLRHFPSLGTFYTHTKEMEKRDFLRGLFREDYLLDLLRLIGVKDNSISDRLREATQLSQKTDDLLHGRK